MRRTRFWKCVFSVLFAGLLMTSCAAGTTDRPGTAAPTNPDASPSAQMRSVSPVEVCAKFLPSASCSSYVSVSGTSHGKNLAWVASGAVTVRLTTVAGSLQLAVKTPCNPVSGPATISETTLVTGNMAMGAMGCPAEAGTQEAWVMQFLRRPVGMTSSDGTLHWKSGPDTLTFRSE